MMTTSPADHGVVSGAARAAGAGADRTLPFLPDPGALQDLAVLEAREGRNWSAEVHCGPLQLVAVLVTNLQVLCRRLDGQEAESVDHLLEIARAAVMDLRQLMARLELPDGDDSLMVALRESAYRVLGADVELATSTAAGVAAPMQRTLLALSHRALVQLRRMGGRAPGRIEVDPCGHGVAVWIRVAAGGAITRGESTLAERARLAGGSAQVVARAEGLVATIVLPHRGRTITATG